VEAEGATTTGGLLGGRLSYRQFRHGHRSGFEPVLLAAALPGQAGQRVLEAGTGAGAALLCAAARVKGMGGIGVELDPALARLAAENFAANGFTRLASVAGDATALPFPAQSFHHVMANPPWFRAESTRPPDAGRSLARHVPAASMLAAWTGEMLRVLRDGGSITLILPAASIAEAAALLRPGCGGVTLLPLWPRPNVKAKMVLLQARKASRAPDAVLPGLTLHGQAGLTPEAEAVLREGQALALR
jgi:tRNA1(Val) A37 N6-methylase TrmN6